MRKRDVAVRVVVVAVVAVTIDDELLSRVGARRSMAEAFIRMRRRAGDEVVNEN